jgi:hypothetical protein
VLELHDIYDVNNVIGDAEEFDGQMPFSVVGTVTIPTSKTPYLIIAKHGRSAHVFDVQEASSEEEAKSKFLGKKRNIGKALDVIRVRDISHLIKEYYS